MSAMSPRAQHVEGDEKSVGVAQRIALPPTRLHDEDTTQVKVRQQWQPKAMFFVGITSFEFRCSKSCVQGRTSSSSLVTFLKHSYRARRSNVPQRTSMAIGNFQKGLDVRALVSPPKSFCYPRTISRF